MQGYRTILFNLAMAVIGMAGLKISPDHVNLWLDVFIPAWALGGILLRQITTTPIGQKVLHDLGISDAEALDLSNLTASLDSGSTATLNSAVSDINAAVSKLTGHPLLQPATVDALTSLSGILPGLVASAGADPVPAPQGQASFTPAPLPTPAPAPATQPAPQPDPVLQPAPAPVAAVPQQA